MGLLMKVSSFGDRDGRLARISGATRPRFICPRCCIRFDRGGIFE